MPSECLARKKVLARIKSSWAQWLIGWLSLIRRSRPLDWSYQSERRPL
jgi:hypothetical protein